MLNLVQRSALAGLANGQVTPTSILSADNGFNGLAGGEPESSIALVASHPVEGHIGGGNSKTVIDLGNGAAVHFLAAGNVGLGPGSSGLTFGQDLGDASGKGLPPGASEHGLGSEDGVDARPNGAVARSERRAVSAEDGPESHGVLERVGLELEVELARVSRQDEVWNHGSGESIAAVQTKASLPIVNLEWNTRNLYLLYGYFMATLLYLEPNL